MGLVRNKANSALRKAKTSYFQQLCSSSIHPVYVNNWELSDKNEMAEAMNSHFINSAPLPHSSTTPPPINKLVEYPNFKIWILSQKKSLQSLWHSTPKRYRTKWHQTEMRTSHYTFNTTIDYPNPQFTTLVKIPTVISQDLTWFTGILQDKIPSQEIPWDFPR